MAERDIEDRGQAWKGSLRRLHNALRTGILVDNILPALRTLLTDVEYLSVEAKEGDVARVDELVKILLTKDESTFDAFCSVLETNGYPHWASRLKGGGITPAVPNVQWQIQFPIIDDLSTEFALLAAKIDTAVRRLNSNRLSELKTCIAVKLKCKDQAGQDFLPSTVDELMRALRKHWDFLNFEFAQLVVRYLEDENLQRQMRSYEENVQTKVLTTLQECRRRDIHPEPPPNCVSMSITINVDPHSYSLHRILQMKDFLVHRIGLDIALFAGWMDGSVILHFYISVGDIKAAELGLKEHFKELQSLQVTRLEVFGRFCLDVLHSESIKAAPGSSVAEGSMQESRKSHKEEEEMDTQEPVQVAISAPVYTPVLQGERPPAQVAEVTTPSSSGVLALVDSELGSLDKAKRTVRRDIGAKWPDLARELGFSQSDIDDIREREHGSIYGQIFEMLRQWERRSDTGKRSVYELLLGLRKAVNNTRDERLQNIRDKVFTDAVFISFPDKACAAWPQLAKVVGLSRDEKRQCSLAGPLNLKTQAHKFLSIWCTKSGWKILEELPVVLDEASLPEVAEKAAAEIFGKSLVELKQEQAKITTVPIPVHLEVDHAVKVNHLGVEMYGTVRWLGDFPEVAEMAGIEMESRNDLLQDGVHDGRTYFTCEYGLGAFVPISNVQKDDRFLDTLHASSPDTASTSPMMQYLADGPPKLLIPYMLGPQQSPVPAGVSLRRASDSASTSSHPAKVQPIQETYVHPSLHASTSMPHSVEVDAPYYRAKSSLVPTSTQPPRAIAAGTVYRPEDLGYTPPLQRSHASGGKVGYSPDTSGYSTSEEDHEIQPLMDLGEKKIYCLRFAGDLGGLIVGRGGSNVRMVEEESHAQVYVMPKPASAVSEDVKVLVIGTKESCMKAIGIMTLQLKHKTANLQRYTETIELPANMAGKVIGQNGTTKQMIESFSGAALTVERRPEGFLALLDGGVRKCTIRGSHEQVEKAKSLISDIQQGGDISSLQLVFAFSQMLRSMPQGVSVLNHLEESTEQDELMSILGQL